VAARKPPLSNAVQLRGPSRPRRLAGVFVRALALAGTLICGPICGPTGARAADPAAADSPASSEATALADLTAEQRAWWTEVALLLTEEEGAGFLSLDRPYRRDAFIDTFWKARDPYPETARNEFRDLWQGLLEIVEERFGGLEDERSQVLLRVGAPDRIESAPCHDRLADLEIWHFRGTTGEHERGRIERRRIERRPVESRPPFEVVFQPEGGRYRLWSPLTSLSSLAHLTTARLTAPGSGSDRGAARGFGRDLRQIVKEDCVGGEDLVDVLEGARQWRELDALSVLPRPSSEWVATFLSRSTDVPKDAATFEATLEVTFPGRNQSRTVVQGLISVPVSEIRAPETPGAGAVSDPAERPAHEPAETYQFLVDGEILRNGRLFDDFRYRFNLPADEMRNGRIPLVVQRYLRPGSYTAVLKVRDLTADAFFRVETPLEVPVFTPPAATGGRPRGEEPGLEETAPGTTSRGDITGELAPRVTPTPATAEDLLAEANAALGGGDERLTLIAPVNELLTGSVRVQARATGSRISKVTFLLNGRPIMSKSRPPYSVELSLGRAPRLHTVEAQAFDDAGREVARDRIALNAGPHRFGVRLTEPHPGGSYRQSLRAAAEVSLPLGAELDRVEIFLNETKLATLYQEPFVQPIVLAPGAPLAYVRAVAYLHDGNSTEDLVFVNSPQSLERLEIDFVELYTSVLDHRGRPVEGLTKEDFQVLEDGQPQKILRFERVRDLPIHAGLVIDTSTSMAEELEDAERAALRFFERLIQPDDRAAVFVFADHPELKVPLTNNHEVLAGGLAGIVAEGETALYDSIVQSVFYFAGIKGKRALILLTDGQDSVSNHSFDEALEFAQRSGIAVYSIGLDLSSADYAVRSLLQRLAHETGGEAFFVDRASQLDQIYDRVEEELRSQYLLGYQSPQTEETAFRQVEVVLDDPDLRAKSIPGYYP
jgi:Ca-activated chloride channel family protein